MLVFSEVDDTLQSMFVADSFTFWRTPGFGEVDDTVQSMLFVAVSFTFWRTPARSRHRIVKPAASAEQKPTIAEPVA